MREQRKNIIPCIFEPAARHGNRERHFGGIGRDIEMGEQRGKIWIGRFVKNDESGVYGDGSVGPWRLNRIAVPASIVGLLEKRYVMRSGKQPCGREPGDARADHGDFQSCVQFSGGHAPAFRVGGRGGVTT